MTFIGALALLAGVGLWTYHGVHETIGDILTSGLQSILQSKVESLRVWFANEKEVVRSWAETTDIISQTQDLLNAGPSAPAARVRALQKDLSPIVSDSDYLGYLLVSRSGTVLVSQESSLVGTTLGPEGMKLITPAFQGQVRLSQPIFEKDLLTLPAAGSNPPVMLASAPIHSGNDIIAALAILIDPKKDFSLILAGGEVGRSGDVYAFNSDGLMLSTSRFSDQLQAIGLIPASPDATSILTVRLRAPGGDLTKGFQPKGPLNAGPLTAMAAAAIAGHSGIDLEGYRDFRGVKVIGTWEWLADEDIGVALEVRQSEGLSVLRPVILSFSGLFGLLVLTAIFVVLSTRWWQRRFRAIKQLGQYALLRKIGEGGMGKVYLARHSLLRRPTALKLIKDTEDTRLAVERFAREVTLTSRLTNPNTVAIYDYGRTPEGVFYYAMEYLPGVNLKQMVEIGGPVPPGRVIHILRQVCSSLSEAHRRGLVHRDIKPLNIMLCPRGGIYDVAKVLDFGLVKEMSRGPERDLTEKSMLMGTPDYIAPERLLHPQQNDVRSDIYSLGGVAYFLLFGRPLFGIGSADELSYHAIHSQPELPSCHQGETISPRFEKLIMSCLAKKAEDRPQTIDILATELELLPETGDWTPQQAREWWKDNSVAIRRIRLSERSSTPSGGIELTIDVRHR